MILKETAIITNINDECILIESDASKDAFHGLIRLNDSGTFVIKMLQHETTIDEIVSAINEHFEGATKEQIYKDALVFLDQLRNVGMLIE